MAKQDLMYNTHRLALLSPPKATHKYTHDLDFQGDHLTHDEEFLHIKNLAGMERAILTAAKNDPYVVTRQVTEIARSFNKFYNARKILTGTEEEKKARALTQATVKRLSLGLQLLGIQTPNEM